MLLLFITSSHLPPVKQNRSRPKLGSNVKNSVTQSLMSRYRFPSVAPLANFLWKLLALWKTFAFGVVASHFGFAEAQSPSLCCVCSVAVTDGSDAWYNIEPISKMLQSVDATISHQHCDTDGPSEN